MADATPLRPAPARPARRPPQRPLGPPKPRVPSLLMRVWDAPTRLFHWAIVLLVAFSYLCAQQEWVQLHFLSGYAVLALLLFRLAWGFIGSETSRFRQFVRSPIAGLRHIAAFGKREPDTEIGHNAAGGWAVLAMLAALLVQAGTGLFSNDDIAAQGPLAHHVSKAASNWLTGLHAWSFWVLLALVAVHIAAIIAYAAVKRHDLVRAMVTGKKRLPANLRQPRFASPVLAAGVLAVSAGMVWVLVRFG
jgi:cytochrome b